MKHLRKYDEFVNEGLMDFLKKAMKGLIDAFSDDTKKIAGKVSQEIEKLEKFQDAKPLIEGAYSERSKSLEEKKNYKSVKGFIKEELMLTELFLTSLHQKFETASQGQEEGQGQGEGQGEPKDKLKLNKFFEDSGMNELKEIFKYEKSEEFQGALPENLKNLMLALAKKAGIEDAESKFADESQNESKLYEAQEEGENLEADESFKKFKETATAFRNEGLVKYVTDKLGNIEIGGAQEGQGEGSEELKKIAETMEGSDNKESIVKILQKIVEGDKDLLKKVRDAMEMSKDEAPL